MTTPEWEGADHNEAPYLPAARPVSTGPVQPIAPASPDAPYVPAPPPVAAPAAEPAPFDARAMVESQKHYQSNPAYGALPTGTEASREAAKQLRAKGQRKRRRNLLLGRVLAVLLIAGIAAGGWFGYQAYQDQQDRDAAERAAAVDDEASGAEEAVAALTPLGEQQRIIEGMSDLNSTARASAGGLLGAVEDAREIVGQADGETGDPATGDAAALDPFAARTVDFVYRRWAGASSTSPMVQYLYSYDLVTDTYTGDIRPGDGTGTITGTDPEYRFAVYADGVVERVPRSAAGLDPTPDLALASVFGEAQALPPTARSFATLVDSTLDSDVGDVFTYTIDTEQWRERDPGSFLAWVTRWNPRPADDPSLVDLTRREVSTEPLDVAALRDTSSLATSVDNPDRTAPGARLTFVLAPQGHVTFVALVDNTADIRVEYVMMAVSDTPVMADLGDRTWVPEP